MIEKKVKPLSEKEITKEIRKFLTFKRIFHWKVWQGLGSTKGVPDILGVINNGTILAIEIKTSKGKLSEHQEKFLSQIILRGGIAFVARSVQDVEDNLKACW